MHTLSFDVRKPWAWAAKTPRELTIGDVNGFEGVFATDDTRGKLRFDVSAENPQTVVRLKTGPAVFPVEVVNEGSKVALGSTSGGKAILKSGAGELEFKEITDSRTRIFSTGGAVTLDGSPVTESGEGLPPGAWLHLDASKTSTYAGHTYDGEDGRTYVTEWQDADGGPISAVPAADYHAPFVSPVKSSTGLALMDFGNGSSDSAEFGPANCVMEFTEGTSNAREVFYVAQKHKNMLSVIVGQKTHGSGHPAFESGFTWMLFMNTALASLREGDIRFNGCRVKNYDMPTDDYTPTMYDLSVISVGTTAGVWTELLGSERNMNNTRGGVRIGEVLIYTNVLTETQRTQVNRYLQNKWFAKAGEAALDASAVVLEDNGATVSVPEGRVARIGTLTSGGADTIVKEGDGKLEVRAIGPEAASVRVEGGSLAFAKPYAVDDTQPAANPYVWLDASAEGTLTTTNGVTDGRKYVTKWTDCRGSGYPYAEVPVDDEGVSPTGYFGVPPYLVENAVNGHDGINFRPGTGAAVSQQSWMWLQPHGAANAYSGFIVVKFPDNAHCVFGSTVVDLNASWSMFADMTYSTASVAGGRWAIDGLVHDPWQSLESPKNGFGRCSGVYHVLSFTSESMECLDLIGKERLGDTTLAAGFEMVAEILYDRQLSADEIRQTEAYLMKRYLNKEHPECTSVKPKLEFAAEVSPTIAAEAGADIQIAGVSGGTGKLVKQGEGNATVALHLDDASADITSVAIASGELKIDNSLKTQDAIFHFDASAAETLTTYTTEDGTTYVTGMDDADGRDLRALSTIIASQDGATASNNKGISFTNPVLRTVGEVRRPVLDFGRASFRDFVNWNKYPESACMAFSQRFENVQELFVVVAQKNMSLPLACDTEKRYYLLGAQPPFIYDKGGESRNVAWGSIWVDGVSVDNGEYALSEGEYHLFTFKTLTGTAAAVSTIANNIYQIGGGQNFCEIIGFSKELSDDERASLERKLMEKWFGSASTNTLDSINVAANAKLDFAQRELLSVSSLGGGGELRGADFVDVAVVSVAQSPSGGWEKLTVCGDVSFANSVNVSFAVSDRKAIQPGVYTILSAENIWADGSVWTVSGMPDRFICTVFQSGNDLMLKIERKGALLIVR